MIIALLDWFVAEVSSMCFCLLRQVLSSWGFWGYFSWGNLRLWQARVPGGIGVFETVVLSSFPLRSATSAIIGSLLAYRGIYYLFPLLIATIMLASLELLQKKHWIQRIARGLAVASGAGASGYGGCPFIGGAILLFSGATPGNNWRFIGLKNFPAGRRDFSLSSEVSWAWGFFYWLAVCNEELMLLLF